MADEYFFALTLKGAKATDVWDPEGKNSDDYQGGHKLIIKQALLGPEAADGEVNVIQVEAMTWKDSIKIPVATLKAGSGSNSQVLLDLCFPDPPVTFSLIQGTGPVHIIGHHLIGGPIEEFDEMDEMEEEVLDEDDCEEGAAMYIKKRKLSAIEEDNEEEEDEDEEGPKSKKVKTANNTKGKAAAAKNSKGKK